MSSVQVIDPPNSIVFVHCGGEIEVPAEQIDARRSPVAASTTCLVCICYPSIDRPTRLTVGMLRDIDPGFPPSFVGSILTPKRRLIVDMVDATVLHEQIVPYGSTPLRCWFSDPYEPEEVFIGID